MNSIRDYGLMIRFAGPPAVVCRHTALPAQLTNGNGQRGVSTAVICGCFLGVDQGNDLALPLGGHPQVRGFLPSGRPGVSPIVPGQGATLLANRTLPRKRPLDTVR